MVSNVPIVIVAGMGRNTRAIGQDNGLIWHVPDDMKRFKKLTLGHPVIMGRKTFESIVAILGKPLPGRTNIVLTRDPLYRHDGAVTVASLEEAFDQALREHPKEIHIGGGAELYRQALPLTDRLHITWFFDDTPGDTTFPAFEHEFSVTEEHPIREHNGISYQWVDYIRRDTR